MDERQRRVERDAATGSVDDEVRLLRGRLRAGTLSRRTLGTLALLGHPPAWLAQDVDEGRSTLWLDDETRLLTALARVGRQGWVRAGVSIALLGGDRAAEVARWVECHLALPSESNTWRLGLARDEARCRVARAVASLGLAVARGDGDAAWDILQGTHREITDPGLFPGDPGRGSAALTLRLAVRDDLVPFLLGTGDPVLERGRRSLDQDP